MRVAPRTAARAGAATVALLAALVLLALPVPARAQESRIYRDGPRWVHEVRGAIPAAAVPIQVDTDLGAVVLRSGPPGEVRYRIRVRSSGADDAEARHRLDGFTVSVSRSGDRLLFRGESARATTGRGLSVDFDLSLPAATPRVEASTGAGDLSADGIEGRVVLLTRAGRITANRIGGPLRAETRGGTIDVGAVAAEARLITAGGDVRVSSAGADLVAQTSGGDVAIGEARGGVRAETAGGSITIASAARDVDVGSSGGNIDLGSIAGRVVAATSGGSIRLASAGGGIRCETGAGPISIRGAGGPVRAVTSAGAIRAELQGRTAVPGDSELQTWQGDVTVVLPDALPVTIRALIDDPAGHRIRSEFPLQISREAEGSGRPTEIGEGRVAGGGPLLKIRALGGDIVILKAKAVR